VQTILAAAFKISKHINGVVRLSRRAKTSQYPGQKQDNF
jgi:hypothetical protein